MPTASCFSRPQAPYFVTVLPTVLRCREAATCAGLQRAVCFGGGNGAPVVQPGRRERSIYLPAGQWRDWWTGTIVAGPRRLDGYPAPLETLPLFEPVSPAGP